MKITDIKAMSASQLNDERNNIKKELFNLRFQRAAGEKIKSSKVRELKKNYARLLTVANEISKK